ncbi:MAG: hypothetical protein Q8K60_04645, partial [Parachlamydiaceae bacterium]|nr:hypothetical protein [Parachlamydiaceae bacterium]
MNSINNLSSNENEPSLNLLSTIILSRPVVSSVGMGVGLSYSIYNVRRDFYGFFPCFGIGLSYGMTYGGIAQLTSRALVIHSTDTIESP